MTAVPHRKQANRSFQPLTREAELLLLHRDAPRFTKTTEYLSGLILTALGKFEWTVEEFTALRQQLHDDVQVAARRYLQNPTSRRSVKFSTYFTWYIGQRINTRPRLKRKT